MNLPLAPTDEPPQLRADAARNRTLLLDAASRLLSGCGAADLTMESVAAAAEWAREPSSGASATGPGS